MFVCLDIVGVENEKQGLLIRDVIEQSLETLLPRRRNPIFIDLHIALNKDMDGSDALIHEEEDGFYFLALNKNVLRKSKDYLITTLIHEMVHVRQFIRKQIKDTSYNTLDEYLSLPHEIEAYNLQEELLDEIKEAVKR